MPDERVFVDTNVFVYAYDRSAGRKHDIAAKRLIELWDSSSCREAGLVKLGHVAIDETLVKANASLEKKARQEGKETPPAKARRNFTDPDSRIMVNSDKAFVHAYNRQVAVEAPSQVIVAARVSQAAPDMGHLASMMEEVEENTGSKPREISADAGYCFEANVEGVRARGVLPFIAPEKMRHTERLPAPRGRIPQGLSAKERMRRFLATRFGRRRYGLRRETVEPVIGRMKEGGGFRMFLLRGLDKVQGESAWDAWRTM